MQQQVTRAPRHVAQRISLKVAWLISRKNGESQLDHGVLAVGHGTILVCAHQVRNELDHGVLAAHYGIVLPFDRYALSYVRCEACHCVLSLVTAHTCCWTGVLTATCGSELDHGVLAVGNGTALLHTQYGFSFVFGALHTGARPAEFVASVHGGLNRHTHATTSSEPPRPQPRPHDHTTTRPHNHTTTTTTHNNIHTALHHSAYKSAGPETQDALQSKKTVNSREDAVYFEAGATGAGSAAHRGARRRHLPLRADSRCSCAADGGTVGGHLEAQ